MRIFISHGQNTKDAKQRALLMGIARALQSKACGSHEVLLDRKRLDLGDAWEGVLHDMLAECEAAVLLLGERAVWGDQPEVRKEPRPWVVKEANVLAYRRAMDRNFPLLPVLLPGPIGPQDLSQNLLSPLCLDAIQPWKVPAKASAKNIGSKIGEKLAAWTLPTARTPLDRLARNLANHLGEAGDLNELGRIAEGLLGEHVAWLPTGRQVDQRAVALARGIVRDCIPPAPRLQPLIRELRQDALLRHEPAAAVLELAAPLWVPPDAAARLAEVAGRNWTSNPGTPGWSVALAMSQIGFTADRVVRRVRLPSLADEVVCVIEGGGSDAWHRELLQRVRASYRRRLGLPATVPDTEIDRRLADNGKPLADAGVVFYAVPGLPGPKIVDDLQRTFPRLTFLFATDRAARALPPRVLALEPAIDATIEIDMKEDYVNACNLVKPPAAARLSW